MSELEMGSVAKKNTTQDNGSHAVKATVVIKITNRRSKKVLREKCCIVSNFISTSRVSNFWQP